MEILRHTSLEMSLINMYRKFQEGKWQNKRDIYVQKIFIKNMYFLVPGLVI